MRLKNSLEWAQVSSELIKQMHSAPAAMRKDLAKMLGNITALVQELGNVELHLRRGQSSYLHTQSKLLGRIDTDINHYEQWVMYAYLLQTTEN